MCIQSLNSAPDVPSRASALSSAPIRVGSQPRRPRTSSGSAQRPDAEQQVAVVQEDGRQLGEARVAAEGLQVAGAVVAGGDRAAQDAGREQDGAGRQRRTGEAGQRPAAPGWSLGGELDRWWGADGTTVLTGVPLWHRGALTPRKLRIGDGVRAALRGLDLGPPIGGRRRRPRVPRTVDPPRHPPSLSSAGPLVRASPEPPCPPFLRSVAVPWGGTAGRARRRRRRVPARRPRAPRCRSRSPSSALIAAAGLLAPVVPRRRRRRRRTDLPGRAPGFGLDGPERRAAVRAAALHRLGGQPGVGCAARGGRRPPTRCSRPPASCCGRAPSQAWENLFFCLLLWGSWAVGLLTRRSRQRAEQLGRLAAAAGRRARARRGDRRRRGARPDRPGRARLGRPLGQRDGPAARRAPDDGRARAAGSPRCCRAWSGWAAQSVDELRGLVGVLRETPDGPPPAAPSLAPGVRADRRGARRRPAGASCEVHGEPGELPQALDVSAYRVLQEALSNVLRHAGPGAHHRARSAATPRRSPSRSRTTARPAAVPAGRRRRARPAGHPRAGGACSAARSRPARARRAASGCAARFPLQDAR